MDVIDNIESHNNCSQNNKFTYNILDKYNKSNYDSSSIRCSSDFNRSFDISLF